MSWAGAVFLKPGNAGIILMIAGALDVKVLLEHLRAASFLKHNQIYISNLNFMNDPG